MITVNGQCLRNEKVESITLKGSITVNSTYHGNGGKVALTRILFPSTDKPAFCEKYVLRNDNSHDIRVEIPQSRSVIQTLPEQGVYGSYRLVSEIKGGQTGILSRVRKSPSVPSLPDTSPMRLNRRWTSTRKKKHAKH